MDIQKRFIQSGSIVLSLMLILSVFSGSALAATGVTVSTSVTDSSGTAISSDTITAFTYDSAGFTPSDVVGAGFTQQNNNVDTKMMNYDINSTYGTPVTLNRLQMPNGISTVRFVTYGTNGATGDPSIQKSWNFTSNYTSSDLPQPILDAGSNDEFNKMYVMAYDSNDNLVYVHTLKQSESSIGVLTNTSASEEGSWTATADAEGYQTSSVTKTIDGTTSSVDYSISLQASTYSISGNITNQNNNAVGGVDVEISDSSGTVVGTVTTASDGSYSFAPSSSGDYTVTPVNYDGSQTVTVDDSSPDATGVDFQITEDTITISGVVTDSSGTAISSATVSVEGQSVSTASDGSYSISIIPDSDTETLSIDKVGYVGVEKTNDYQTNTTEDVTLTAETYTLDGVVEDGSGVAIENATVTITDSAGAVVTELSTDATGSYSYTLSKTGEYTVSVSKTDYQTESTKINVTAGTTSYTNNFIMSVVPTYTLEGQVTSNNTSAGIENVTVTVLQNGTEVTTTTTDTSGNYSVTLNDAGDYTVSFSDADYVGASETFTVTNTQPTAVVDAILDESDSTSAPGLLPQGSQLGVFLIVMVILGVLAAMVRNP